MVRDVLPRNEIKTPSKCNKDDFIAGDFFIAARPLYDLLKAQDMPTPSLVIAW